MQLYLNSLTWNKPAACLFPQLSSQNEVCPGHLAFSWTCSWLSSQMQNCWRGFIQRKAQVEKKTQLVTAATYSKENFKLASPDYGRGSLSC